MPGFLINNVKTVNKVFDKYNENCIYESFHNDGITFQRNTLNKFLLDKCFFQNEKYVIIQEGVLLNKASLFKKYACDSVENLIVKMLETSNTEYWQEFKGTFSGAIYDIEHKTVTAFTNQIGDAPVFYCVKDGFYCIGSQIQYLIKDLHELGITISPSISAVYQMLTYGFMIDNSTYCEEIKRLQGGEYIVISQDGSCKVKRYHSFEKKTELNNSLEDIMEELENRFREAVYLEYSKDIEYGYRHFERSMVREK